MGSFLDAPEKELEEEGKCELLGMFGFFIQFVLGIICFSVLVIKRQLESPKRSLIIWFLDISKQGISTLILHFFNLFFSVVVTSENEDQCVWYLNNVLLDGTIGVIFQWIFVRCLEILARRLKIETLTSGCYSSMFGTCTSLEDITLSNNIDNIASNLFGGCTKLKYVKIPDGVNRINSLLIL